MDRVKNNPRIPFTENHASVGRVSNGTTGHAESIESVVIPNVGETIDAPTNRYANWSAENPYDK